MLNYFSMSKKQQQYECNVFWDSCREDIYWNTHKNNFPTLFLDEIFIDTEHLVQEKALMLKGRTVKK